MSKLHSVLKSRDITLTIVQSKLGFARSHIRMRELDHKEG